MSFDPENGSINIIYITKKLREDLYEAKKQRLCIWSSCILKEIMIRSGFNLTERFLTETNTFIDVYKLIKSSK